MRYGTKKTIIAGMIVFLFLILSAFVWDAGDADLMHDSLMMRMIQASLGNPEPAMPDGDNSM